MNQIYYIYINLSFHFFYIKLLLKTRKLQILINILKLCYYILFFSIKITKLK